MCLIDLIGKIKIPKNEVLSINLHSKLTIKKSNFVTKQYIVDLKIKDLAALAFIIRLVDMHILNKKCNEIFLIKC